MRGKIINLNKINKVLKVLARYGWNDFVIYVSQWNSSTIKIPNKSKLDWEVGERLVIMLNKENINWNIEFKDNNMIINIW